MKNTYKKASVYSSTKLKGNVKKNNLALGSK